MIWVWVARDVENKQKSYWLKEKNTKGDLWCWKQKHLLHIGNFTKKKKKQDGLDLGDNAKYIKTA